MLLKRSPQHLSGKAAGKENLSSPEMQDRYVTKTILQLLVKYKALHTTSTCTEKIKEQLHEYILPDRNNKISRFFLKQQ